jgi:hypothetical protein
VGVPRTIQDDRGATLRIATPDEMIAVARAADGEGVAAEVYRRLEGGQWAMRAILGISVLWMAARFVAGIVSGRLQLIQVVTGLAVLAVLFWVIGRRGGLARRHPASVRSIMLEMGRCPACGYSLQGLAEDADWLTVCSECGGAWRVLHPVSDARGS